MGTSLCPNMWSKTVTYFFLLTLQFSNEIHAGSPVEKIGINEFEVRLTEHGHNFSQIIKIDKLKRLTITEVPAHNGRIATIFYADETNGLTLEVSQETKTASFHRSFMGQDVENQESVLEEMAMQGNTNFEDDRIAITPDTASEIDLLDIEGPEVSLECVPEKYKDLIPKGFKIQLVHQVQEYPGQNVFKSEDKKNMTVFDPLTQKDYSPGDDMDELFKSIFEGILPPCAFNTRKKRSYCIDENGRIYGEDRRCTTRVLSGQCKTCRATNVGYDCARGGRKCTYVLKCTLIDSKARCIEHIQSSAISCTQCCLVRNCPEIADMNGKFIMPACRYIPTDDICPLADTGCPKHKVVIGYTENMVDKECNPDPTCSTIYDARGSIQHSGINCAPMEDAYEKKFCCNSNDDNLKHNLGRCGDDNP